MTRREIEIVGLVADGLTARQIAGRLGIRPRTVQVHVANARDKLGAANVAHLVAIAFRTGLLDPMRPACPIGEIRNLAEAFAAIKGCGLND